MIKLNAGKDEAEAISADDFIPTEIKKFIDSSYSYTISLAGAEVKTAKSVLVEEMNACLHFYSHFQTVSVGFFTRYAEHLGSTQIDSLYRNFSGEVAGYFTRNRPLQKLLWANHGVDGEDALFSPFKQSLLVAIEKHKCLIDPSNITLSVVKGEEHVDFALQVQNDRVDLKSHARVCWVAYWPLPLP